MREPSSFACGRKAAAAILLATLSPCVARADVLDATWLGGTGSWNDPTKWSGGVVPNNTGGTTYRAFIPTGSVSVPTATPINIDAVTLNAGGSLTVRSAFNTIGARIDGNLAIAGVATNVGPPGSLVGTGTIMVSTADSSFSYLTSSSTLDIGSDLTIRVRAFSYVGLPARALINRGYIVGGWTDTWWVPEVGGSVFRNLGTIEARNGIINLGNGASFTRADLGNLVWGPDGKFSLSGTLLNQGQTLSVDASHPWLILGGTVQGGTIDIASNTFVQIGTTFRNATLDDVFINGRVLIADGSLDIKNGVLRGNADIVISSSVDSTNRIVSTGPSLTIDSGVTVRPYDLSQSATVGNGAAVIINHGMLRTSNVTPSTLYLSAPSVVNDGTMDISDISLISVDQDIRFASGGILDVQLSAFAGRGLLKVNGQLDLSTAGDNLQLVLSPNAQRFTFYRIATTTGGVIGTFDSVTPGFEVMYTSTEIFARQIPEPSALVLAAIGLLRRRRLRCF